MKIKLWGVRGSLPTPLRPQLLETRIRSLLTEFAQSKLSVDKFFAQLPRQTLGGFGGNTACIEVSSENQTIVVDGGSGLRHVNEKLMKGPCAKGEGCVDILFTHFHWDHLVGLPFFVPIFIPGNQINVYSVQSDVEQAFRHVFQKPYFPVPYERLGAKITYHQLEPRQTRQFGDLEVTPYQLDHPDPCWGYKFVHQGKTFSYCVDTECVRTSRNDLGPDRPLYEGVDLMVFDAQYTFAEALEKIDWGHASAPVGLDLAIREGIKKVVFIHHDPSASDEKIADAEAQTLDYYQALLREARKAQKTIHEVDWEFGYEGMELEL